jgi:hypothetical protein
VANPRSASEPVVICWRYDPKGCFRAAHDAKWEGWLSVLFYVFFLGTLFNLL